MAEQGRESAVVGGGCFWCMEAVFKRVDGILGVTSGYSGGHAPNPTYEEVCGGATGHAEVVRVEFDPSAISYDSVLKLFFRAHDPTTLNRQGADIGTQYRSIVLYSGEAQREIAARVKEETAATLSEPVVTEIVPLERFYPAEDYHHDYFGKNPTAGYCRVVIAPKLEKMGMPKIPLG